jgi:hypothetical protein
LAALALCSTPLPGSIWDPGRFTGDSSQDCPSCSPGHHGGVEGAEGRVPS